MASASWEYPYTNYQYKDLWLEDSMPKQFVITDGWLNMNGTVSSATVTITNTELEQEAFELKETLNASENLQFGSSSARMITFRMHENVPSMVGKWLNVYGYLGNDPTTRICFGRFKVDEDSLSADRTVRTVKAYDAMYDALKKDIKTWYNNLFADTTSVTLVEYLDSLASELGFVYRTGESTGGNLTMSIRKTIEPSRLSGADALRCGLELIGKFGFARSSSSNFYLDEISLSPGIDDGLFPSDTLYPADDLYPQDVNPNVENITKSYYTSVQFEDYNAESITQVVIRGESDEVGVTVGTAGNTYTVSGNFLLYGKSASELTTIGNNLLNAIKNRYYRPATVECKGNPFILLGSPIRISTTYRGIVTYVLERTLKGIQSMKDTYVARGEQYYSTEVNSIRSMFQQLEGKTVKIKADVDGIETEVTDLATATASSISQLSGEISLKVSVGDIMDGLATETAYSAIKINPNSIQVTSSGTFTVDSSNFKLTSSGYCEMGNCMIKGGTIALGTSGSTKLWIDLDRGFQMSDGSNFAYLQEGYLAITAYHAHGDRMLRFDSNGLTLSDNAAVTVSEFNVPNGGAGASKTQRSVYWRKASNLGNNEYVLCGA